MYNAAKASARSALERASGGDERGYSSWIDPGGLRPLGTLRFDADLRRRVSGWGWVGACSAQVAPVFTRTEAFKRLCGVRSEESTIRDIVQLGFSHAQAHLIVRRVTPPGLPAISDWLEAVSVAELGRQRSNLIFTATPAEYPLTEKEIVRLAAQSIAQGTDVFVARADLAVQLVQNGFGEILAPNTYDPTFLALNGFTADQVEAYLLSLEQVQMPGGVRLE